MIERGLEPPKGLELEQQPHLQKWLTNLWSVFPKTRTFSATLNPTLVSANSESTETFTVTGLTAMDIVTVIKPTKTAGLSILDCFATTDTLSITFRNFTGAGIDPGSETYLIKATRL